MLSYGVSLTWYPKSSYLEYCSSKQTCFFLKASVEFLVHQWRSVPFASYCWPEAGGGKWVFTRRHIHTCTHACIHTEYIHAYVHTGAHTYMHTHTYVCKHIHSHTHARTLAHIHTQTYKSTHVHTIYTHIMFVHMYMYLDHQIHVSVHVLSPHPEHRTGSIWKVMYTERWNTMNTHTVHISLLWPSSLEERTVQNSLKKHCKWKAMHKTARSGHTRVGTKASDKCGVDPDLMYVHEWRQLSLIVLGR